MKLAFVAAAVAIFGLQQPRDAVNVRPAPAGTSELAGVVTLDDQALLQCGWPLSRSAAMPLDSAGQ
jgi:hypothetical protein